MADKNDGIAWLESLAESLEEREWAAAKAKAEAEAQENQGRFDKA